MPISLSARVFVIICFVNVSFFRSFGGRVARRYRKCIMYKNLKETLIIIGSFVGGDIKKPHPGESIRFVVDILIVNYFQSLFRFPYTAMIGRRFPRKPRGYLLTPRLHDVSAVHLTDVGIFYVDLKEIVYKTYKKIMDRSLSGKKSLRCKINI